MEKNESEIAKSEGKNDVATTATPGRFRFGTPAAMALAELSRATFDAPLRGAQTVIREHFGLHLPHHLFDSSRDVFLPRVLAIPHLCVRKA